MAIPLLEYVPSCQSGVALRFPPQSKFLFFGSFVFMSRLCVRLEPCHAGGTEMNTGGHKSFLASHRALVVCLLLAAVTLAVFWPAVHHEFINYDDNCYVVQNYHVQAGLTWPGLAWAFGRLHGDGTYWHPLTWVSHMLDCQLFGLKPAGHHLVNLLWHALNSVLVFVIFRRLTRAFWRSALLAALFALHPLQVDTVAWVAERKNLLSALFWLLTIWAYARYAEGGRLQAGVWRLEEAGRIQESGADATHHVRPPQFRDGERAPRATPPASSLQPPAFYCLALFFFVLGLMCKPVLVTLPFVLLLLDYWPLARLMRHRVATDESRRVHPAGRMAPTDVGGYALSTSRGKDEEPQFAVLRRLVLEKLPFFVLSAASCFIAVAGNRAVGAMLDAAAGFPIQIRLQNALFSYAKYIGKSLWPVNLAVFYPYPEQFPLWRAVGCGLLLVVISGLALIAARRRPHLLVGWFWFAGVLVPFSGLIQAGEQAMADRFAYVPLMGLLLLVIWTAEELTRGWRRRRLFLITASAAALVCCAALSRRQIGHWQDSVTVFTHALAAMGESARGHANLGMALADKGETEAGIQQLLEAIRLDPAHAVAHMVVGHSRTRQGRFDEAIEHYEAALRLKPNFPEAINNLAWLRATHPDPKYRNGAAAVDLAESACRLTERQEPLFLGTLAAAYAEAGRFDDAIKTAEQAQALAAAFGREELAARNRQLLELYRAGKPFHEPAALTR